MDPNFVAVYFRNVSVKLTLSKEKMCDIMTNMVLEMGYKFLLP